MYVYRHGDHNDHRFIKRFAAIGITLVDEWFLDTKLSDNRNWEGACALTSLDSDRTVRYPYVCVTNFLFNYQISALQHEHRFVILDYWLSRGQLQARRHSCRSVALTKCTHLRLNLFKFVEVRSEWQGDRYWEPKNVFAIVVSQHRISTDLYSTLSIFPLRRLSLQSVIC